MKVTSRVLTLPVALLLAQNTNASLIDGCMDFDWDGETDMTGDGCTYYDYATSTCGEFDDGDFFADAFCCACGGGFYYDEY